MGQKTNSAHQAAKTVAEKFKKSVQLAACVIEDEDGPAVSDLTGAVLRRRKAAALSYMDTAYARYAGKYPYLDMEIEWARLCATPSYSINRIDEEFNFSMAAALWLLDALCDSCSPADIEKIFPIDSSMDLYGLEFMEPRYDNSVICSAVRLLQNRDGKTGKKTGLVNNIAAQRIEPYGWSIPNQESCLRTDRERFNAAMAFLPSDLTKRATSNFINKMWEFIDRYFACVAEYARREARLNEETTQLEYMSEAWEAKQSEADNVSDARSDLRLFACMLPVLECGNLQEWRERFTQETRLAMEEFTVDDPYEICFAFLYLIETGSDLPWLYAPALAVLMAAAAKLPWNIPAPSLPDLYVLEYCDDNGDIMEPSGHPDLTAKKATGYVPKYRPDILPHPLDPEGPYRSINLPQLIYGLSGMIMPRAVSESDKVVEALVRAGVSVEAAPVWEQYLRLASELQTGEHMFNGCLRPKETMRSVEDALAMEKMDAEIRKLKKQLKETKKALRKAMK